MSYLRDDTDNEESPQRVWSAVIKTNAVDISDRVSVLIPALDENLLWEDCRWQARDATSLPVIGDACVVIIDENSEVWIVAWWPFAT